MNEQAGQKLWSAYFDFVDGKIERRELIRRAGLLGMTGSGLAAFAAAVPASAQEASPVADYSSVSITADEGFQQLIDLFEISEPEVTGGTLVMGINTGLSTFNPLMSADSPSGPVTSIAFDTLYSINPTNSEPYPRLLEQWELAADGVTYTFHVRQDVTWHDGTPFTADDVVFTFEALSSDDLGSAHVGTFQRTVASFSKIDDYTVEVVASQIMPQIVFLVGILGRVVAKHVWESVPFASWPDDGGANGLDPSRMIGTGAFQFVDVNASDQTITMQRYDGYYGQVPNLDEIVVSVWPDMTSAVEALRAGQIDTIVQAIQPTDAVALEEEEGVTVSAYDTFGFYFAAYNLNAERTTLFQEVQTRQALMHALDRQSIVDNILLGYAVVAHGTQPVLSPGYAPDEIRTRYDYDVEKAKALLAEVGWVDSDGDGILERDGEKFEFSYIYSSGDQTQDQIAAYMTDAYSQIGISMTQEPVDFATVLLGIVTGPSPTFDYELLGVGFGWDVSGDQARMFSTDAYPGQFNIMKYSNPDADAAMAAANASTDPTERRKWLVEATNIVNDDCPAQVLYFTKGLNGSSASLQNYYPNTLSFYWFLPYVWIAE